VPQVCTALNAIDLVSGRSAVRIRSPALVFRTVITVSCHPRARLAGLLAVLGLCQPGPSSRGHRSGQGALPLVRRAGRFHRRVNVGGGPLRQQTGNGNMTTGAWVIAFAALWGMALTMVVLNFAGIRRGTTRRWQGTGWLPRLQGIGWLLIVSALLVNTFGQYRGWSSSRVHSFLDPVLLAALVLMIGPRVVMMARKRRRARRDGHPGE
jgi:hypothetical protein